MKRKSMKNVKKVLASFLVFAIMLPLSIPVMAIESNENTNQQNLNNLEVEAEFEKINDILSKMSMAYAIQLRDDITNQTSQDPQNANSVASSIEDYEAELFNLGVSKLTYEEVLEKFPIEESEFSTRDLFEDLPCNDSICWYASPARSYEEGNTRYKLQFLYAQAKSEGTNLAQVYDDYLYKDPTLIGALEELAGIYIQKAIGLIPIVQWTPYELLFCDRDETYRSNGQRIMYTALETACFAYVYPESLGEDYVQLTYSSNMFSIAAMEANYGFKDGKPFTKSWDQEITEKADNYAKIQPALEAYENAYADIYSFADPITFTAVGEEYSKTYYPACATAPGHIN